MTSPAKKLLIGAAGLVVVAGASLVIANTIRISSTRFRLESRIAALRQVGDPVSVSDLKRWPPPAEQNAATYLRQAREQIDAWAKDVAPLLLKQSLKPMADQAKGIRQAFKAFPDILPSLQQAAECSECCLELPYDEGPGPFRERLSIEVQMFSRYTEILTWETRLLMHEGKVDEALGWWLVSLRLSRLLDHDPPVVGAHLVAMGCRSAVIAEVNTLLRSNPVSSSRRAELDKELAEIDDQRPHQQAWKGERALELDKLGSSTPVNWINRADYNNRAAALLDSMNQQLTLATRNWDNTDGAMFERAARASVSLNTVLGMPAYMIIRSAVDRIRAQARCLRLLNAMQQKGLWDASEVKLADLGLPAEAITDPYDGSPIKLKRRDGTWIIYCVGPDLRDDGGAIDSLADIGLGPAEKKSR